MLLNSILCGVMALVCSFGNYEDVKDSFNDCISISFYENSNCETFLKDSKEYKKILIEINKFLNNSYQMPALGVSIDNLTRKEMCKGIWLEFNFENKCECYDLPFESLLIKINKGDYGVNIIRKVDGKYDGRCFYINTKCNMNDLYELLKDKSF